MKEILKGSKISKIYGDKEKVTALDGVDISIQEGEFVCIMGPSGSGKTTLLNMLATIDKPTKGSVEILGKDIKKIDDRELSKLRYENIGFVFQNFNLVDTLTLKENISMPLVLADVDKEVIEERVNKLSELLDLEPYLDKFPIECSGGQNQRAASARALMSEPKLIVADEPTGNLDTKNSHNLLQFFKDLNEKEKRTILMVTHDSMIASYSKKLIFLRDGKVDEVIERGNKTQSEFFYDIVEITSRENQNLFNVMGTK